MGAVMGRLVWIGALGLLMGSAAAVELPVPRVRHGTEGLAPMTLRLTNAADTALDCQAQLAHWYSQALATLAPGETAAITLWRDPATGTLALLNEHADNLPVEALWCGRAGQAYATRGALPLDHAGGDLALTCRAPGPRVVCD